MNRRRVLLVLAIVGSVAFIIASGFALYLYQYGQADRAVPSDVIIVLGAGTRVDGSPNRAQLRRVRHAVTLYERKLAPYVLCTGGYTNQHPKSEADSCVAILHAEGVPDSAILREDISTTTIENVIEARKVMDAHGLKTAIIVSDNYHLWRAEWLFREYSMTVTLSPAEATQCGLSLVNAALGAYREVGSLVVNGWRIVTSDYREQGKLSH